MTLTLIPIPILVLVLSTDRGVRTLILVSIKPRRAWWEVGGTFEGKQTQTKKSSRTRRKAIKGNEKQRKATKCKERSRQNLQPFIWELITTWKCVICNIVNGAPAFIFYVFGTVMERHPLASMIFPDIWNLNTLMFVGSVILTENRLIFLMVCAYPLPKTPPTHFETLQ